MVGKPRSHLVKEVVALFEGVEESAELRAVHAGNRLELLDPGVEGLRLVHAHGPVGAEGGVDLGAEGILLQENMGGEIVGRVVGGADDLDVAATDQALGREIRLGEEFVAAVPDPLGAVFVEDLVDAKSTAAAQGASMVERIAQRARHGAGVGEELVEGLGVASAKALVDSVGAHGAPFVVISAEPDVVEIGKLPVGRDLVGRQVAMVVENGLLAGVVVVQPLRAIVVQQEVVGDEGFHF